MKDEIAPALPFRPATNPVLDLLSEAVKAGLNPLFISPNGKDLCVLCYRETEYDWDTPVERRYGYTDGGQLCKQCRTTFA